MGFVNENTLYSKRFNLMCNFILIILEMNNRRNKAANRIFYNYISQRFKNKY